MIGATIVTQDELIELGKQQIFAHVKELMANRRIDLRSLVFGWEHDPVHEIWSLRITRSQRVHSIAFSESVIEGWPTTPGAAEKYQKRILTVIDELREK